MKIYIGSDHRGFHLKEKIFKWLVENDYLVEDMGAYEYDKEDDYTLYAEKVASVVGASSVTKATEDIRGVLLCGSGVGVDIVANKFDGVRASVGIDSEQIKSGRKDDDMNILVLAADHTGEHKAKDMVKAFLETKFDKKTRHKRRLSEIEKIEANN